jgi:ABC-2 type transport system permease protein
MISTPTRPGVIVLGEMAGRVTIGIVQSAIIVALGALVFGIDWGDPFAVSVLVIEFVVLSAAAAIVLGSIAPSIEHVVALTPVLGLALATLGGCIWPLNDVSSSLRELGHAFPHAWAMDALNALAGGGGVATVGRELLLLAAFVLVTLGGAVFAVRRGAGVRAA